MIFPRAKGTLKFHAVMRHFEATIENKRSGTHRHRHCTRNCQKTYGSRQSFPFWVSLDNREVFFIIVLTPAHNVNVEQCSSKVYSISTYFSGPHRPRSRRNSSVRPFEAFELWFLENIHTQKYFESKVLRHSLFYLNVIDKWLRNAREVLLWCVAGLKSKQLKRN